MDTILWVHKSFGQTFFDAAIYALDNLSEDHALLKLFVDVQCRPLYGREGHCALPNLEWLAENVSAICVAKLIPRYSQSVADYSS